MTMVHAMTDPSEDGNSIEEYFCIHDMIRLEEIKTSWGVGSGKEISDLLVLAVGSKGRGEMLHDSGGRIAGKFPLKACSALPTSLQCIVRSRSRGHVVITPWKQHLGTFF